MRLAVNNAKSQSMPKDNIQRIDKATAGDDESFEEVRYEGYGPGGSAIIVETLPTIATVQLLLCVPLSVKMVEIWVLRGQ